MFNFSLNLKEVKVTIKQIVLHFNEKFLTSNMSLNKIRRGLSFNYEILQFVDLDNFKVTIGSWNSKVKYS